MKRTCKICLTEKNLEEDFRFDKKYKCYGHQCKKCLYQRQKIYKEKNFEKFKKYEKEYIIKNKAKKKEYDKQYSKDNEIKIKQYKCNNREKHKLYCREYNKKPTTKRKKSIYQKKYYAKNREKCIRRITEYNKKPSQRIKNALYHRIKDALKQFNISKKDRTLKYTGCSIKYLVGYLESKFLPGMNWDNYGFGNGKWVIDHIIPCRAFDLTQEEQQYKCFHHSNLQPLWFTENCQKLDKLPNGTLARNKNEYNM